MKLAILERIFSPPLASPVTFNRWMEVNHRLDCCLEARGVHWQSSLVATAGDRSVCLFQVPYTDAVREANREARMPFERVWPTNFWIPDENQNLIQGQSLVVAEVNYNTPLTTAGYASMKHQARKCLDEMDIQSIFSMIALDGRRSICVFSATSAEEVRSLYRKVNIPFERIWKATLIQPDPKP